MKKQVALIGLCSLVLSSSPFVLNSTRVLAEEQTKASQTPNILTKTLDKEKEEVKRQAEKVGFLPSVLMALWVRNTDFGLNPNQFSVSDFVSELVNSNSELAQRLLETGSSDEAVALLFKYKYSSESDFVGSMNSALSLPYVKGLDKEVYPKGIKPLYDKDELRTGKQHRLSWVSLNQDADVPKEQEESQADSSLAFERVGEKRLAESNSVGFLLPNTDKQWWQFWKKGLAESKITFEKDSVNAPKGVVAVATVFAKKLGWSFDGATVVRTSNGLYAVGSDSQKVLVNKLGKVVAVWTKESKPYGFEGVQQIMKGAEGYLTIGLRSSSLLEDTPGVEFALNKNSKVDEKLMQLNSNESIVGTFTLYDVGVRFVVVEDSSTGSYKVLSEFGGQVGSSNKDDIKGGNLEDLAVYTPIKTEVGVLWVQV
jgi:hypothetical protein